MTWHQLFDYVKTVNIGGYTDWRLSNVLEMQSLVDYSQAIPALPPGNPFTNVQSSIYWSSTPMGVYTGGALVVGMRHCGGYCYSQYVRRQLLCMAVPGGQCGSDNQSFPASDRSENLLHTNRNIISCIGTGQDEIFRQELHGPARGLLIMERHGDR